MSEIAPAALARLFTDARTHNKWRPDPVSDETLRRLADLVKLGPTAANGSPARFVFLRTPQAKARLEPHLSEGNRAKTMQAPVVVLVGADYAFHENLPKLFPHADARSWFAGNQALIDAAAFRNSSLQGGYLIMAARALGLDCGPMSGFDAAGVDKEFFAGTTTRVNFISALGHGDPSGLFQRNPRLDFEEFCELL
jgi:3-hydroxypropanoate dehydrogenase